MNTIESALQSGKDLCNPESTLLTHVGSVLSFCAFQRV